MKLLLHVLWWDVRGFRWPLALWCGLVAAEALAVGLQPAFIASPERYARAGLAVTLVWLAVQLGMIFLVPAIIQAHPAVGTDAFWITRPVPRRSLWAAKLILLVAVTVIVPALAQAIVMLALHLPAAAIARVAVDTMLSRGAWLGILVGVAATTENLGLFALAAGGVLAALIVMMLTLMATARGAYVPPVPRPGLPPPFDPLPLLFAQSGIAAAAFVLALAQYRTRLRRMSLPLGIGLGIAVVAMSGHLPVRWPVRVAAPDWSEGGKAAELVIPRPEMTLDRLVPPNGSERERWRFGRSQVEIRTLAPAWQAEAELLESSVRLPAGRTIEGRGSSYRARLVGPGGVESPSTAVAAEALHAAVIARPEPSYPETTPVLFARNADLDTAVGASGRYQGRFAVALTRWEAIAAVPLASGVTVQDGDYRFTIADVMTESNTVVVLARETRATSSLDRRPGRTYLYYLRNSNRREAVAGSVDSPSAAQPVLGTFHISYGQSWGFVTRGVDIAFPARWLAGGQGIRLDPDWFAGAELVVLRASAGGVIERTLDVADMKMVTR